MIYKSSSPYLAGVIDEYATGHWGEDMWGNEKLECCACHTVIRPGYNYFDIDEEIYCENCSDMADEAILEKVRNKFIFEL